MAELDSVWTPSGRGAQNGWSVTPPRLRLACLLAAMCAPAAATASDASPAGEITVSSVVLRLVSEAEIPAQEAGLLADIGVTEGERVAQGDILATLDDHVAQLAVRKAKLDLAVAKEKVDNDVRVRYATKALEVAAAELERSEESIRNFPKSVSQSQLDVEKLTVQKTSLEIEQAGHDLALDKLAYRLKETELAAARLQLERRRVRAPFDGQVVEIHARAGEWVQPGERVMRVINTDVLKAEGFLSEAVADRRLVGSKVWLETDGGERQQKLSGQLVFVSPETDPINRQVRVWAEVPNPDQRLRPGQRVQMVIVQSSTDTAQQAAR